MLSVPVSICVSVSEASAWVSPVLDMSWILLTVEAWHWLENQFSVRCWKISPSSVWICAAEMKRRRRRRCRSAYTHPDKPASALTVLAFTTLTSGKNRVARNDISGSCFTTKSLFFYVCTLVLQCFNDISHKYTTGKTSVLFFFFINWSVLGNVAFITCLIFGKTSCILLRLIYSRL